METIKSPRLAGQHRPLTLLLAVSLALASGCAQIPRLYPPPAVRKIDELGSSKSFAAPLTAWPGNEWWRAYGDPQLDALIEQALHNAPDLDLAQAHLKPQPRRFKAPAPRACPK